jgi:acid phosphatase
MTTLQPRAPYSNEELSSLYPPQLRLHHVQILLRHGERTPVNARFANAGLAAHWPYCNSVRQLRSVVLDPDSGSWSALEWRRRLETFGSRDVSRPAAGPRGEVDSLCDLGMLTDRGRETTFDLGKRLRRLYVDQLGFLPPGIRDADFIYLRSTPIPRALESLQQTFHGLYPLHTRDPAFPPPTIVSRYFPDETLFPNEAMCRRFAVLSRAFAQRTADRWNDSEDMAYLNKKIGKWMPEDSPRVAVDSHPRLSGIMDSLNATSAHGPETRLPAEFYDPKIKQTVERISTEEWYSGYKESREYRMLGIGGQLGDIVSRMVGSVEHTATTAGNGDYDSASKPGQQHAAANVRFGLSGCHDTTLAGALSSLGAFDTNEWPPFTSHIAFELFRDAHHQAPAPGQSWFASLLGGGSSAGAAPQGIGRKRTDELSETEKRKLQGYYVRLRYNDNPVTIPGCKAPGKHFEGDESFCTLVSLETPFS